jgi:dATP/dGTP diphosphohydrolase
MSTTVGGYDATRQVPEFVTKDSGVREEYASGMVRDTQNGKPRYNLIDRPFLKRWAELMTRGAEKYGTDNWRNASSQEELDRFQESALRHMMQWLDGETDEDHAAAVAFNLAAAEYVKGRLVGVRLDYHWS